MKAYSWRDLPIDNGGKRPRNEPPTVTLTRSGHLRLSGEASDLLDNPDLVQVMYDPRHRAVAIRATYAGSPLARRCTSHAPTGVKGVRTITTTTLRHAIDVSLDDLPITAPAVLIDGLLVAEFLPTNLEDER